MANLNATISNQFKFNLPSDFLDKDVEEKFYKIIKNSFNSNFISTIDYINASFKDIVLPSINFETSSLTRKFGHQEFFNSAKNVHDSINREINIVYSSKDGNFNYFIIFFQVFNHYMNTEDTHFDSLYVSATSPNGDELFRVVFKDVLFVGLSEIQYSESSQVSDEKTFSLTFKFNEIDIISSSENYVSRFNESGNLQIKNEEEI